MFLSEPSTAYNTFGHLPLQYIFASCLGVDPTFIYFFSGGVLEPPKNFAASKPTQFGPWPVSVSGKPRRWRSWASTRSGRTGARGAAAARWTRATSRCAPGAWGWRGGGGELDVGGEWWMGGLEVWRFGGLVTRASLVLSLELGGMKPKLAASQRAPLSRRRGPRYSCCCAATSRGRARSGRRAARRRGSQEARLAALDCHWIGSWFRSSDLFGHAMMCWNEDFTIATGWWT